MATIGIISIGEMGLGVAQLLKHYGYRVVTNASDRSQDTRNRAQSAGVELLPNYTELFQQCNYIISIVPPRDAIKTAELVSNAAKTSLTNLPSEKRVYYLDLNAVSPHTARYIATLFASNPNIQFLDGGIIGGVPHRKASGEWHCPSLIISGPTRIPSDTLSQQLRIHHLNDTIGTATGLKMCFGMNTKGFTALAIQSFTTAHKLGVLPEMREYLKRDFPETLKAAEKGLTTMPPKAYRWVHEMLEMADTAAQDGGFEKNLFEGVSEVYRAVAEDSDLGLEKPGARVRVSVERVDFVESGRPSSAIIRSIQSEKKVLETVLVRLKNASPEETANILNELEIVNGSIRSHPANGVPEANELNPNNLASKTQQSSREQPRSPLPSVHGTDEGNDVEELDPYESDGEFDASKYLSVDDQGQVGVFGLTSTLHNPAEPTVSKLTPSYEVRNQLVANAALERQKEFSIRLLPDIDGVPLNLAMHLLDLHWNRQHHTFLLTYRPAFMRDLVHGGQYCSEFLLNAIFACASKYSDRIDLRDDPLNPLTAGGRFFRRCDEILVRDPPWGKSSIPTVVGFLLLGSTFISRGEISKGWSYSGFAMRMAFDLGLHLDCRKPGSSAEDAEIRKRVYWGAFICDKLQSLYLGRPFSMQLRDCHVSTELMDTMEELDLWVPYVDPESPDPAQTFYNPTPVHSVSTFQQLCELSKLMARIISRFYSAGVTPSKAQRALKTLDECLTTWHEDLPGTIRFEPWSEDPIESRKLVPPNVMNLHNTYHSLVILLHRPFISEGNLRSGSVAATSWKKCTAAARNITSIVGAYRSAYSLRGAPYLTSYAAYVACTIHVRNAALETGQSDESLRLLLASLKTLDELSVPNPGVARPASIIRRLMESNGIAEPPRKLLPFTISMSEFLSSFIMDSGYKD
ncbi:hypothetical protein EG329_012656 [Mollisiaceae sp. DMI_Dod_QoI]|nr:hypothetical protein EG329_012656 [Helotiales sp. DMI_Dod_QoI]